MTFLTQIRFPKWSPWSHRNNPPQGAFALSASDLVGLQAAPTEKVQERPLFCLHILKRPGSSRPKLSKILDRKKRPSRSPSLPEDMLQS